LLSSGNVVVTLSRVLTQASSPDQVMRLVTAAIPSIVPCHTAVAWHPSKSGDYYQRAPSNVGVALARLTRPGTLEMGEQCSCWAFPLSAPSAGEPIFLITFGSEPLSNQNAFLLSELAQLCGAVIGKLELVSAEQANLRQAATRNAELESTVSSLTRILEAANDAVINVDRQGRVMYVNSAFENIFGYRAADVTGRELTETVWPGAGREAYQGFAWSVATGQQRFLDRRIETTAMRADGGEFPAEVTAMRAGLSDEPIFTIYIRDITQRQHAQQELMASRARLVAASDMARERVTRDLHDGAQQRFVTSLIHLQLAEQQWEDAPEHAKELLGLALRDAKRGIDDLREIVAGIHPAILNQRGLAAAIDALTTQLPIPVELDVPDQRLPSAIEASVYFFCSEALTNVIKHAQAQSASVRVHLDDQRCAVEVRDDGMGGAMPRADNSGLNGLRDRIGALSGTMDIVCPAAGGTVLRASVPLPREPASPAPATPA